MRADIANLARCMLIPATLISSGLRSSHTVESHSLNILIPLSVLRFSLRFFISAVSVCDVSSSVTFSYVIMTSLTPGKITVISSGTDMDRERLRLSHAKRNVLRTNM